MKVDYIPAKSVIMKQSGMQISENMYRINMEFWFLNKKEFVQDSQEAVKEAVEDVDDDDAFIQEIIENLVNAIDSKKSAKTNQNSRRGQKEGGRWVY